MSGFSGPPNLGGLWTPVLTFATPGNLSVAYVLQAARYVKSGLMVNASFVILTSAFTFTTASGKVLVTGLPFSSSNNSANDRWYSPIFWQGITKAGYTQMTASLQPNSAQLEVFGSGSGVAVAQIAAADMPTGGQVILAGTIAYEAAA